MKKAIVQRVIGYQQESCVTDMIPELLADIRLQRQICAIACEKISAFVDIQ